MYVLSSGTIYILYYMFCNRSNTTGVTSGARTSHSSGAHEFIAGFSGVRVVRSLVSVKCYVDYCLFFSSGHCNLEHYTPFI